MASRGKNKGDRGELEVQQLWRAAGFKRARRALGAGRKDDVGDIDGLRELCLQVSWPGIRAFSATLWGKVPDVERQRSNRRSRFGALFIRTDRRPWIVVLTPTQFIRLYKYALIGLDEHRRRQTENARLSQGQRSAIDERSRRASGKMSIRGNGRRGST